MGRVDLVDRMDLVGLVDRVDRAGLVDLVDIRIHLHVKRRAHIRGQRDDDGRTSSNTAKGKH